MEVDQHQGDQGLRAVVEANSSQDSDAATEEKEVEPLSLDSILFAVRETFL